VDVLTYSLIAAGVFCGLILGWFIRHKLLKRHLTQARTKQEELRTLNLTIEQELSALRQKLIQFSGKQEKISSQLEIEKTKKLDIEENTKKIDTLQTKYDQITEDNEALHEQINYYESEQSSYQKYREQAHLKIKQLSEEKKQLQALISQLQKEKSENTRYQYKPGSMPVVQHVDKEEWKNIQKEQEEGVDEKDKTSKLKERQSKSTDRVNTREEEPEIQEIVNDEPAEPSPQQNLFPPEKSTADVSLQQTMTDEQQVIVLSPSPPKPKPKPIRDTAKPPYDPFSELAGSVKKRKKTRKGKKKKPSTVRIDTSSSDIITSFKKELGLPDK